MQRSRGLVTVLLMTIVAGACTSTPSGDCYWQGPPDELCLDEWVITLVWRGTAAERTDEGWRFLIEEAFFELGSHTSAEGTTITHDPRTVGDTVVVTRGLGFRQGEQYVIASAEVSGGREAAFSVYDAETMRPLFGARPLLTDLLDSQAASSGQLLAALVDYVEQAAAYREAVHTGDVDPSAGPLLRRAWGLRKDIQPLLDSRR